ncbi:hypothetical protein L6164_026428 [Bauhinia variegata]|uniref:Uncharacterized protein n=1 Tax=Bauhinia variegata TaxID=167791 RepID=A0ACB9LQE0_BAUVA|nr:hypothetical protein L6164_026428 [Bauhinia variegata]
MQAETETTTGGGPPEKRLNERKISWANISRVDSLNLEAGRVSMSKSHSSKRYWFIAHSDAVVGISVAILIILFCVQRFGTDKVGFSFAPIVLVWFSFIGGIGLYNLLKFDIGVLRALNPKYIVDYLKRNGKKGWISLGGIFLCITGTEAMFADLGHFNVRAIQLHTLDKQHTSQSSLEMWVTLSMTPYLISTSKPPTTCADPLYWPTFVVAVAAAIIASQAMISGAFSIIQQSMSLGCFPRVSVIHTSAKYEGQVYIPEVNYMLMIACVLVTAGFRTTDNIGHAYGISVCTVMVVTTCMLTLIMLVIWKTNIWLVALFFLVFGTIEFVFLSSMLYKFKQGGFLPLLVALFLMTIMATWHFTQTRRYTFELNNKVSGEKLRELVSSQAITRIPGAALLYSELVEGIPPIFSHFAANISYIPSVVVIVSMKRIPISRVVPQERFLFRQVGPREYRIFRCVVRFGYKDAIGEPKEFEGQLVENLKEFIGRQCLINVTEEATAAENEQTDNTLSKEGKGSSNRIIPVHSPSDLGTEANVSRVSSGSIQSIRVVKSMRSTTPVQGAEEEIRFLEKAMEKNVLYMLGEAEVVAEPNSSILKKIVVNYAYNFLRRNFRQGEKSLAIPHSRLVRIGMTYEI